MARRITIIQGHPDPAGHHLLNAMADAYAEGATSAGHQVRRIEVAKLEFPLLRTQAEFEAGTLPSSLVQAQEDLRWAEHWVFCFRSGTEPCRRCSRGFSSKFSGRALRWSTGRLASRKRLLAGRSARIVVTMGMPVWIYRWYFGAYGLRSFERSMLGFAGIKPIRESLYGLGFADEKRRARWIEQMRASGSEGR